MAKKKLGLIVTLGAIAGSAAWVYKKYDSIKSMYQKVSIFKGERIDFDTFDGEAIAGMFSGLLVDLSSAEFSEKEVYLDLYGFCSGIRVLIPKDVEVVLEGTNRASGVHIDQDEDVLKTHTLFINYNLTASGLSISDNIDDAHEHCCEDEACCKEDEECTKDEACCNEDDDSCCEDESIEDISNEAEFNEDTSNEVELQKEIIAEMDSSLTNEQVDESDIEATEESAESDLASDEKIIEDEEQVGYEETFEDDEIIEEEKIEDEPKWANNFDMLNNSALELDQAAAEVEEAIEQLIDTEEIPFDNTESEVKDEFFD